MNTKINIIIQYYSLILIIKIITQKNDLKLLK